MVSCTVEGEKDVQMVPQPDLQGATAHMSAEDVQNRLEKKAEELKNDESLTPVRHTYPANWLVFEYCQPLTPFRKSARLV